jgi:hypothetical protein
MSQHHFVVMYDTETKQWDWFQELEEGAFPSGGVYSTELQEWLKPSASEHLMDMDTKASEQLGLGIRFLNYCEDKDVRLKSNR